MSPLDGASVAVERFAMNDSAREAEPTSASEPHRRWIVGPGAARRRPAIHIAAAAAFVGAAAGAWLAQQSGFPLTAAIVFLLGVTIVGALEGMRGGLIAAIVASLTYNFFLIEPTFRFSLATLDDYVPLLAFNLAAAASGFLAGRLNDRALAAEQARRGLEALLDFSQTLQAAVDTQEVAIAVGLFAQTQRLEVELHLIHEGEAVALQPRARHADSARKWIERGICPVECGSAALLSDSSGGRLGFLFAEASGDSDRLGDWLDLAALANLTSIALERCLLLARLAEAELVRKSEELKSALLSSLSHDLRTPLTAISASATSLARYGDRLAPHAKADMLDMIQEQCQRLNRYTTNLLNLGRLQAGLDTTAFLECDAIEALNSAVSRARELAPERRFVRTGAAGHILVSADPVMLEQVFYNVLENSVRYSDPAGPIQIHAEFAQSRLHIVIRDEGEGIPPADIDRVFDRFHRASDAHAAQATGLGLSIAKGFIDAFGGRIRAERPDDAAGGTLIRIDIPAVAAEARQ